MAIAKKPVTKVIDETATVVAEAAEQGVEVMKEAGAAAAEFMKPLADFQEKFRAGAEKGLEQLRAQYATMKGNAETATDKLEESVAAAHAGTREFNMKVLELFRAQTNAGFAHLQALFSARTLADAVKLQQDFAKSQVETLQAQSKDLGEIVKKVATEVVEPVKSSIVLPFQR